MIFEQRRLSAMWGKSPQFPKESEEEEKAEKRGIKGRNIEGGIAIVVSVRISFAYCSFTITAPL